MILAGRLCVAAIWLLALVFTIMLRAPFDALQRKRKGPASRRGLR